MNIHTNSNKKRNVRLAAKTAGKPAAKPAADGSRLRPTKKWRSVKLWQKIITGLLALLILSVGGMYAVAQWYIYSHRDTPITLGATFIPGYARYFGLDPHETMQAAIDDLGIKRLRLVSYWDESEPSPGNYSFSDLDWEFKMAEAKHVKISLAIGLRQPRWPECHMPGWAASLPDGQWQTSLQNYMSVVIERYKNSPALDSYQLENEYFLKVFGICKDFSRQRLISEYNLVKRLDPHHTLVVSMSNNAIGTPLGQPTPDEWAISVYKRVWDKTITKRYFEYPIPAWYYAFRAGFTLITRHRDSFIHELQAEAWLPDGYAINDLGSLAEQNKSMTAQRFHDRIEYGRATGMKQIDLWGMEYWYWRKVKADDPSLWTAAKQEVAKTNALNAKIKK